MVPPNTVAIIGVPGSGKTTLAEGLSERLGYNVVSSGDIARAVDSASLAVGDLADEALFREAWARVALPPHAVIDGLPRSEGQVALLPDDATVILLTCRSDIAISRLLRRGRDDDRAEIAERRVTQQQVALEGWAYQLADWNGTINTTYLPKDRVLRQVVGYLMKSKPDAH